MQLVTHFEPERLAYIPFRPSSGTATGIYAKRRRGAGTNDDEPLKPETDHSALIQRIVECRDKEAFAQLFDHFAPRIKAMLMRSGAPSELAEDLAQDAMLTLWRKADFFDPSRASVAAWVFTIARNLRIDVARRERRAKLHAALDTFEPESQEQPDQLVSLAEREQRVRLAMQQLPVEQAEVVKLSFVEGKAHGDIAKCLSIPLGTVKSRLRLAMGRLRQLLEEVA
jgi:RNA polymerase sigma-70 factor (ECF subfamily)